MGWHYQIRKRSEKGYTFCDVVEVYEDPRGWTVERMLPYWETREEVIEVLERMLKDVQAYPVLDEDAEGRGQDGIAGE